VITDGTIAPLYSFLPDGKGYFTNGLSMYSAASARGKWNGTVFSMPLSVIGALYGPAKMVFTNEKTGWLIPGGESDCFVLKSTDGGGHWSVLQNFEH